jgi:hypothetical protein
VIISQYEIDNAGNENDARRIKKLGDHVIHSDQPSPVRVLRWEEEGYPVRLMQLDILVGNSTNEATFEFPDLFERVPGANLQSVVLSPSQADLESMILSASKLIEAGAKAITTSCGFNTIFQRELANAVDVPVFTSSLLQIPIIRAIFAHIAKFSS